MSDEPAHYHAAPAAAAFSLHLPFALLATAFAVILIAQTGSALKQKEALEQGKKQLAEAYEKRDALVKQSAEVQAKLQSLVMDLITLSKTDDDAKTIVTKYNIQQTLPAAPALTTPAN